MSIEKSKLKVLLVNDIGSDIEDQYESTLRSAQQQEGAAEGLKQAALKVPAQLVAKIDDAMKEGAIKDGMSRLQVVSFVKKYLGKVGEFLAHLSAVESQKAVALYNEARGLRSAITVLSKTREKEIKQLEQVEAALASGEPLKGAARPPGVRPGPSTASKRKAQEKQSRSDKARKSNGSLAERRVAAKKAKLDKKSIDEMDEKELEAYLVQGS